LESNLNMDKSLLEKLDDIREAEEVYEKSVAKKFGIVLPKIPKGIKIEDINRYSNAKSLRLEKGEINPPNTDNEKLIEDYVTQSAKATSLVRENTPSYLSPTVGATSCCPGKYTI